MSFMDAYRAGVAEAADVEDYIVYWQTRVDVQPDAPGLEDYLGMTWKEFNEFWFAGRLPAHQRLVSWPLPGLRRQARLA